jgi:lipopolysaccharide transport system permease protein
MGQELRELYRYRELLYTLAHRDIKVRYKQSIMGLLWALLMPTVIVISGIVVRYAYTLAAHTPLDKSAIASVAVRSLPWAFLVSSVRFSCNSLTSNKELVTKIYFPKEMFPMAAVLASLFDLLIASAALTLFLVILHVGLSAEFIWVPVLLLIVVMLATGVGMMVSAASLFFRDVKYIVEILLTFGIFFTPVFYDTRMFGEKGKWLLLNPVAPLLEGLSSCIVQHRSPDLQWFAYSLIVGLVAFIGGYTFFKHLESAFAESI